MRLSIWICLLLISACGAPVSKGSQTGKTYHVYFLGGQSNMEGWGNNEDLPEDYVSSQEAFPIFMGHIAGDHDKDGGRGLWARIEPGFGRAFRSNGRRNQLSRHFGPEISFSREMKRLFPDRNIAVIKYARGGASIEPNTSRGGNFLPSYPAQNGPNQFDFAVRSIRAAMKAGDIDGDGRKDRLVPAGIAWMQGESDASALASAQAYAVNLDAVISHLRTEFGSSSMPVMPVVIGKIAESQMTEETPMMPYIELVHAAKENFVAEDVCAALMTETETYTHAADGWHYVSEDYLKMGRAFAQSFSTLSKTCAN